MEITIKNNKLNYEILKKNGQYFLPSSFVLIFKLVSLYYVVLILISIYRNRFKLWTIFIVPLAIIIVKILINYFARKLIDVLNTHIPQVMIKIRNDSINFLCIYA